jgi:hypothetical protein
MEHNSDLAVLIAAAWCGLLTGLLEGAAFLRFPLLRNPDLPWIAVLFDLALFLVLGCGFVLLRNFVPHRARYVLANFVFTLVLFYDSATVGVGDHGRRLVLRVVAAALAVAIAGVVWKFPSAWQRMQRRSLVWLAISALLYTGIPPLRRALQERRQLAQISASPHSPNVILIIVDALRADHLSTYGYARNTSPHLSQFATRGALFRNAIAAASWTLPSHASILTGQLPHVHGADEADSYLDGRFPTLAEAFRKRGYRTAAFSANWWFFARRLGFQRGFIHFQDFNSVVSAAAQTNMGQRLQNILLKLKVMPVAVGRSRAPSINRDILQWIDSSHGPFFVMANYMDVHGPYTPPLDCFHRFSQLPQPRARVLSDPSLARPTPGEVKDEMDAYDASIYCFDQQWASLQRELQERKLLENTVVVFTSDHGDEFAEHGLMSHGNSLYRELIHVPLMMVGPGIPAGISIEQPVSLMWLPATLLTLTGGNPGPFPAVEMQKAWSGGQQAWPAPVSELKAAHADPAAANFSSDLTSIVTPKWHLIDGGKSGVELYPCCTAGPEVNNVSAAHAETIQLLGQMLEREKAAWANLSPDTAPGNHRSRPGSARNKPAPARDWRKINDYLKALGYVPQ